MLSARMVGKRREANEVVFVMPGLVPGIYPSACSGARAALDPGNECRDDVSCLRGPASGLSA
jgi:hypothetical protein